MRLSLTAKLAAYFQAHPGERISWRVLAGIAGGAAWRTRCSELRATPWHLDIRNTWWTATKPDGSKFRESVYWLERA